MHAAFVLMHFTIDPPDSRWHDAHAHTPDVLDAARTTLPNLYCISFIREADGSKTVLGGMFIRTGMHHELPNFAQAMAFFASQLPRLNQRINSSTAVVPMPLAAANQISEEDMLKIIDDEFLRLTSVGPKTRQ